MAKKNVTTGKFLSKDSKVYDIEDLRGPPGVIRTKGANIVCPIDGKMGAAYVHCLEGDDHVGKATHMLSYSWGYSIGDIVDTLSDFCLQNQLDPKRTYIWICCLCVNQHRVVENSKLGVQVSTHDFFAIFGERVKRIGHLLAMMAPWNVPVYITRVWCIFDIFTAHTNGCKVDIIIPPREMKSLEQDVLDNGGGINALYEALGNTKVENAKASVESDRLAVLGQIESTVGYSVLNNQVNDLLRGWMLGVLTQLVETRENTNDEDYIDFCNQIGVILRTNGEHDAAMKLHQTALAICETVFGKNHEKTAKSYNNVGAVLYKMGDYKGALAKHNEAVAIRLSALGNNHPDVATTHSNIGFVLDNMGDYEGAFSSKPKGDEQREESSDKPESTQLDTLGVSVFHLEKIFLEKEVCASNHAKTGNPLSRASKIYDVEDLKGPSGVIRSKSANTVCPVDKKMGAAYIHCLEGKDHVGEATHMLSYSWGYSIGDVVDTLTDFCLQNNLNPKRTYIWICCLCVNQHRVAEKSKSGVLVPTHEFFDIFGERVKTIGHLLAMMAPWNAPVYITRVWCIFEIFTAHRIGGCKVDIVMPPQEKQSLELGVIENGYGINALYETLGNTKVENAKASVESDREAILAKVKSDVGYSALNNLVNDLLRGWMLRVLTRLVETKENTNDEEYVVFCNQIGNTLRCNGEHDAALKLHQTALEICVSVLGQHHRETAETYSHIGEVLHDLGDFEGALSKYEEALALMLSVFGKNHPDVATTQNNIGSALRKMGDYEGALAKCDESLAIRLSALGKNHPDVAVSYHSIGSVLDMMGDCEGALSKCKEALAISLPKLGKNHPDVATTYSNIGLVMMKMGDYDGALAKQKEALAIGLSVLGKNHPDTAQSYHNIGCVLYEMGDYSGALLNLEKCLAIWEPALGSVHADTKTCLKSIEIVKAKLQDQSVVPEPWEEFGERVGELASGNEVVWRRE